MKRMFTLLLVLTTVLSLLAECGGGETETAERVVETTAAPTEAVTEPTTEPTLSPEEQLLASLPEKMRQVYEIGIAELDMLADLERECTIAEAAQMLQKAYAIFYGTESKLMADILAMECGNEPALCVAWRDHG